MLPQNLYLELCKDHPNTFVGMIWKQLMANKAARTADWIDYFEGSRHQRNPSFLGCEWFSFTCSYVEDSAAGQNVGAPDQPYVLMYVLHKYTWYMLYLYQTNTSMPEVCMPSFCSSAFERSIADVEMITLMWGWPPRLLVSKLLSGGGTPK